MFFTLQIQLSRMWSDFLSSSDDITGPLLPAAEKDRARTGVFSLLKPEVETRCRLSGSHERRLVEA